MARLGFVGSLVTWDSIIMHGWQRIAIRGWAARNAAPISAFTGTLGLASALALSIAIGQWVDGTIVTSDRGALEQALQRQRAVTLDAVEDLARRSVQGAPLPEETAALGLEQAWVVEPHSRATGQDTTLPRGVGADGSRTPLRDVIEAAIVPLLDGKRERFSGFVSALGGVFDVAAVRHGKSLAAGPEEVVVGLRPIDARWLGAVALAADVRGLRLIDASRSLGVDDRTMTLATEAAPLLVWRPDHPGRRVVVESSIVLALITVFSGVWLSMQRRRREASNDCSAERNLPAGSYDWLSGLPNRVYFNHVLERALAGIKTRQRKIALFYVDIDRFKDINDSYGLEAGDAMIQAITQRIATVMQPCDLMARFEGDAFLILQTDVGERRDCEILAQRLLGVMRDPFTIDGSSIGASVSIGVALGPDDATERARLMQVANLALFRAKREGRGRMAFYKPMMEEAFRRLKSIESELREAIEHEGLVLRYQPIVSTETGRTVCVEALVRWQHPTEGLIAPDCFIGLAEDRGLILPLGEWVLRQACMDARRWPGLKVAVNVSPIQFRHPGFVATVRAILAETRLDPCRLELELTEGVLVENEEEAFIAIAELRDHGVRMALDDFGTGYSSLIYLRRFSFDKIKIDRAFVEALEPTGESAILVDSVVRLGRALGMTVTAEGVETPEQRDFLKSLHCDQLQGYLISRPVATRELSQFLDAEAASTVYYDRSRTDERDAKAVA